MKGFAKGAVSKAEMVKEPCINVVRLKLNNWMKGFNKSDVNEVLVGRTTGGTNDKVQI